MALIKSGTGASREQVIGTDGASRVTQYNPEGFVPVVFQSINGATIAADTLVTLTPIRAGVAGTPATSMVVTTAKRIRLQGIQVVLVNAGAVQQSARVRLRVNPAGAAIISSPIIGVAGCTADNALANGVGSHYVSLEDHGADYDVNAQFAVSQYGIAGASGLDVLIRGYEYTP